jgi:hypothetical protein
MALRSFYGSCATLITSVVNLSILMALKGEPGWICLMCCNADILFCVVVLHWVTSKEQKEEESAFCSHTKASNHNPTATIGSHVARSRRVSTTLEEKPQQEKRPDSALDNALRRPATITTECKGKTSVTGGSGRTRHRRGGSWDAGEAKHGANEDEVELRNIRVQTIQTREVEVDGDVERHASEGASTDGEGDEWVGSRRGVVVERIV